MNTQDLINMLEDVKIGGISKRPREISFSINGKLFMPEPEIKVTETGDGLCGPEVTLTLTGKEMWKEPESESESRIPITETVQQEAIKHPEQAQQKPLFSADAAEEYFANLCAYYRDEKNRIFKRDNEGRHPSELIYSAESQKLLGMELAMREVLEYFSKFDLPEWRPGSEAPKKNGEYLVSYHFGGRPILIHFAGVFDYYLTDPEPHWQHTLSENGPVIDWWMPIQPTPDKETEDTYGQTATD